MHDEHAISSQAVNLPVVLPLGRLLPEEDVAGGVKASSINLSGARGAVSDDPACESTYCTLSDLHLPVLIARYRVHDHKVDRGLRRTSDLKHVRLGIQLVLHYDCLVPGQGVGYAVLLRVQNGLCVLGCPHHIMSCRLHPIGTPTPVQHKLAPSPAFITGWQVAVVPEDDQLAVLELVFGVVVPRRGRCRVPTLARTFPALLTVEYHDG